MVLEDKPEERPEVKKPKKPTMMTDSEINEAIRREFGYDIERVFTDDEVDQEGLKRILGLT